MHRVRVRVLFGGKRYLGVIAVPPGVSRVSDVLNDANHFLYLEEAQTMDDQLRGHTVALNKHDVTFVQALEEVAPVDEDRRKPGRWYQVEANMKEPGMRIRGTLFVPDGGAGAPEMINDSREFLNLCDVEVLGTTDCYPYLAISKSQVIALEVMAATTAPAELPVR